MLSPCSRIWIFSFQFVSKDTQLTQTHVIPTILSPSACHVGAPRATFLHIQPLGVSSLRANCSGFPGYGTPGLSVASIITMTWWPRTLTEVLDVKLQRQDRSQQGGRSREAGVYLGFPCQRQANGTEGANRKPRPHPRRQRDSFRWDSLVDCNDAESVRGSRVLGWDVPWVEMKVSFAQLPDVCGGFCGNGSSHRNKPLGTNARPSKRRGLHVQFIPLTPPAFLIPRYR